MGHAVGTTGLWHEYLDGIEYVFALSDPGPFRSCLGGDEGPRKHQS